MDPSVFTDPPPQDYRARVQSALDGHYERVRGMTEAEREREQLKASRKKSPGKKAPNYNKRTEELWRSRGCSFAIAESYNAFAGVKHDLFGFIDAIAVGPDEGVVGIQMTSRSNMAARMSKAKACPAFANWIASGARFVVIGWSKNKSGRYEFVERWASE